MDTAKNIRASFKKLHGKIKSAKEISEEDLRVAFVKSGILEALGYEGELKDIRFEKGVRGKRSDLLAFDDYQNVVFVVEFKRPNEIDLEQDFTQLWERYVKPLKAQYGVLTDGLELLLYERINSNWERKLRVNLGDVTLSQCEEVYDWLKKPRIERTRIEAVLGYFERFDNPEEKVNLSTEIAQQHFFDGFELKEGSVFVNLVQKTIGLFDFELERSKFLKSAYNFWKISYAKKPEKVPENWRRIMDGIGLEANEENLFKFMFCLESAYSLFTRLILAKACEDYKLPYVEFSKFIKTEIERTSYRGDITLLAWAITTKNLIESMKQKLVKSVFEGDIFYWWEDSYKEISAGDALYSPRFEKQKGHFGEALAEIILTLYKFDFSEIVGDPLGTLYQRYFDKETRKALGEFYTPQEVVTYILDAVGYEGRSVINKRLLDPACGSGTFLVEALRRYLKASEQIADEEGWSEILKELCNEYRIAGFDIHPFATFMAQMQFMLVLIPKYKKAMEEDPHFVLNRLPIFRTDSLVDETKGEAQKVTLEESAKGIHFIAIDTGLPVEGGDLKIKMPYFKEVIAKTDLPNVEEYFAALQAVFDTVKEAAWQEKYEVSTKELERNFKRYLKDKEWNGLVSFFAPYAKHFLQKFKELKETFGDGKLIKSLEDIILAAILKNYVKYDFVVGNPPYVRVQMLQKEAKEVYNQLYESAFGSYDLYCLFIERGIHWLVEKGKFGYITSNQFMMTDYGERITKIIINNTTIEQILDFRDTGVFRDATNYPAIILFKKISDEKARVKAKFRYIRVKQKEMADRALLNEIIEKLHQDEYYSEEFDIYYYLQKDVSPKYWSIIPPNEKGIFKKLQSSKFIHLKDVASAIFQGIRTSSNNIYVGKVDSTVSNFVCQFVPSGEQKTYLIESALLRKFLQGKEIKRWQLKWSGLHLLHPYLNFDGDTKLCAEKYFKEKLPKTWDFLLEHREYLKNREKGKMENRTDWYGYIYPKNLEKFESQKIIAADISNKNAFVLDTNGEWYFTGGYGILIKEDLKDEIKYILGLLNSKVLEFYFKQMATIKQGGFYEYRTQYLERLPISLPKTPKDQNLADEITKNVEQILEQVKREQKIENFPEDYVKEYRSKGEEFDSVNITFNSNHKTLEPVVNESIDGRGYNIVIDKKEKPVFVESKIKADYVLATLKGKRAKKDEKLQLLVPKNDAVVEAILKELEEDKAQIKSPSVAELEEEINALVYKLYGLNEDDIKVIGDFLRRF